MSHADLAEEAPHFAREIQQLLDAVLPGERHVRAIERQDRYVVRPEAPGLAPENIPLYIAGDNLAKLRVSFRCYLDHQRAYLAVEKSEFTLISEADREPLVRLEFQSGMYRAPAAHWQVHAERGAFSALLARARTKAPHDLASLHLPVGGARMRPCLEDFLQFLVRECRIDHHDGWEQAVVVGRERWRRRQIAALVRDAPDEAIRVLEENGYRIQRGSGNLPGRLASLQAW